MVVSIRSFTKRIDVYRRIVQGYDESARVKLPILDVKTRWNSFFLLERALIMQEALNILTSRREILLTEDALNNDQWTILRNTRDLLEIFRDVSTAMEGYKKPTLCHTVLLFDQLIKHLTNFSIFGLSEDTRKGTKAALDKINAYYSFNTPIHFMATVSNT